MRRKWFKRIAAFSLSVVLTMGLTPDVVFAAENEFIEEIEEYEEEGINGTPIDADRVQPIEPDGEVPVNNGASESSEPNIVYEDIPDNLGYEQESETFAPVVHTGIRPSYGPATVPSAYNSTGVDTIALPAMPYLRSQYGGTCWAHASMALAELSLIQQGLVSPATSADLSELHLAYFMYNSIVDPLGGTTGDSNTWVRRADVSKVTDNGGNLSLAENVLANWVGAVDESVVPEYDAATQALVDGSGLTSGLAYGSNSAILTDYYNVNIKTNPEIVKNLIMTNGGASLSYYACDGTEMSTYYNDTNNGYYYTGSAQSNHEVTIVGWNDDYPATSFNETPSGNGAWLVRNSWVNESVATPDSDRYSVYGYFWISYYDKSISENAYSFKFDLASAYDHNYQYDGGGSTGGVGFNTTSIKYANVFEVSGISSDKEELKSVSFATRNTNVSYDIKVYQFEKGDNSYVTNPESGSLIATVSGLVETQGYYTIPLTNKPVLDKGMHFSVVVELSAEGQNVTAAKEYNANTSFYKSSCKISARQSFICSSGRWQDLAATSSATSGGNFRIKAFTSDYTPNPSASDATDFCFLDDVSSDGVFLLLDEEYQSNVEFTPSATSATVTYSSSDSEVAVVNASGKVLAKKVGTAVITGKISTDSGTREVSHSFIVHVANISIDDVDALILGETGSKQLKYTIELYDNSGITGATWSSSDSTVIAIDSSGKVVPKKLGWSDISLAVGQYKITKRVFVINALDEPKVTVDETGEATIAFKMTDGIKRVEVEDVTIEGSERAVSSTNYVTGTTNYSEVDSGYKNQPITSVKYSIKWVFEYNLLEYNYSKEIETFVGEQASIYYHVKKGDVYAGATPAVYANANSEYELTAPTNVAGYNFGGWYTDALLTSKADSSYIIEKPTYDFYGALSPVPYSVSFSGNGADAGEIPVIRTYYDESITLPTNSFTRIGHSFNEWNTRADGMGTAYAEGDSVSNLTDVSGNTVTLFAIWTVDTYTITYDLDGGTNNANNPTTFSGDSPRFALYPATKPGYTFMCWADGADNVISYIIPANAKDLVLHAKYTPNTYTFRFDGNGADAGFMDPETVRYGDNFTMPSGEFSRLGCTFKEWNTASDGSGTTYTVGQVVKNVTAEKNKEITLYAIWDGTVYTIGYTIDADVVNPNPSSYNCASGTYTLKKPTRTGYTFVNWTDSKNSNKIVTEINATNANGLTLVANWEVNRYYLAFLPNGANMGGMNAIEVAYNTEATLPECGYIWPGHTFSHYITKPDDGSAGTIYHPGDTVRNLTSDNGVYVNLITCWTTSTYKIEYDLDGGVNNPDNIVTFTGDSNSFALRMPTKTGYIFEKWVDSQDKEISQITISRVIESKVSKTDENGTYEALELKAVWTPITYQICYIMSDTVMKVQPARYDEVITLEDAMVPNEDFAFVEWNDDAEGAGNAYSAKQTGALNLTAINNKVIRLYAIVKLDFYYITYELDGGENHEDNPSKIRMAGESFTLEPATKTGYLFDKWTDTNGDEVTSIASEIGSNITLTANYLPIEYTVSYDANGGEGQMEDTVCRYDEIIALSNNAFTYSGKAFASWNTAADGSGTSFTDGEEIKNLTISSGDTIILYAQWVNSLFDIQYKLNGGTNSADNPLVYDAAEGDFVLKAATKTGYNFVCWTEIDGNKVTKLTMENALGITLYANYSPIRFGIIYYGNGTYGEVTRWFDYDVHAKIAECTFTKEGYTFSQWNTMANGTGDTYTPGQDITNLFDTDQVRPFVLYAIWASNDGRDDGIEEGGGSGSGEGSEDDNPGDVDENAHIEITPVPNQVYTGKAIKPDVEVKYGDVVLTLGKDYVVNYTNNVKAGAAKIVVNGKGNYKDSLVQNFIIEPVSIQEALDELLDYSVIYAAKKGQKPVYNLTYNGTKLTLNKDYKVSWTNETGQANKACVAAGSYPVTIEGMGNYSGSVDRNFIIATNDKLPMGKATIKAIPAQKYADYYDEQTKTMSCEPIPEVSYKGIGTLERDIDYKVHWTNNNKLGTGTLTIEGMGAFAGTKSVNFKINGTSIAKAKIEGLEKTYAYTGNAIEPEISVKLGENYLGKDEDCEIVYSKNVNAGKALITITGKGAYSGTIKVYFNIAGYNLADPDSRVSVTYANAVKYAKGGAKPVPRVAFEGAALTEGKDYTITYYNNNVVRDAYSIDSKGRFNGSYFVITGKGNFRGKYEKCYFTITEQTLNLMDIVVNDRVYSKKASNYTTGFTITDLNGKKLVAGKDYLKTVSYACNGKTLTKTDSLLANSTVTITITGCGAYTGVANRTFRIIKYDIAKASVSVKRMAYTGNAIRPGKTDITVSIKINNKSVTLKAEDYEIVSYTNNINKGTATLTIKGKGEYGGYKTVKFIIDSKSVK